MKWKLILIAMVIILGLVVTIFAVGGNQMKQQLINLNPFKSTGVMAQASVQNNQTSFIISPMKIQSGSPSWKKTKHDGIQLQYFNTTITTLDNTKAKICLYPKASLSINNQIIQNSKAYLFKNNVQTGLVQPADMEVEKQGGNVKKMCLDVDGSLIDRIKFGNASIVYEYQNDSKIIYDSLNLETNFTLMKYNSESYVIAPQDIWIKTQEECLALKNESALCFGAIDNALNETELHNYKYLIESTDDIKINNQIVYNSKSMSKNRTLKTVYNFKDICKQEFSNCSFNLINNKTVEVYFTSNKYIDPTVNLVYPADIILLGDIGLLNSAYTQTNNELQAGCQGQQCGSQSQYNSFIEFNISSLTGKTITNVSLNLTLLASGVMSCTFVNMTLQPSVSTAENIWQDVRTASNDNTRIYLLSNDCIGGNLGENATIDLQNAIDGNVGYFAVGIDNIGGDLISWDISLVSLDVEYSSPNCWSKTGNVLFVPTECIYHIPAGTVGGVN